MTRRILTSRFRPLPWLAWLTCGVLAAVGPGGCTSEDPNEVGRSLVTTTFDTVLTPLGLETVTQFSALEIEDTRVPFKNQQVLYLGSQNGNRSSLLANFDFEDPFSEEFPESLFTRENIKTVRLSLQKISFYGRPRTVPLDPVTLPAPDIWYSVHVLDAPFDSTAFPGAVPPFNPVNINRDYSGSKGDEPLLPMDVDAFLGWLAAGGQRGFVVTAGAESDSGLVGFAARDLTAYSQIDDVVVGTVVAPNFVVDLESEDLNYLLAPYSDVSTFDQVVPAPTDPTDGFMLRTCLRNYPALLFDFTGLPADVYINRAVLRVRNDPARAFGNLQSIVISEMDSLLFTEPDGDMSLSILEAAVYEISGLTSVDPTLVQVMELNVTQYVQRRVNNVYEGTRGLVLTDAEAVFPAYIGSPVSPDFYFNEWHFFGTAADDTLKPQLRITYTRVDGLDEGERP